MKNIKRISNNFFKFQKKFKLEFDNNMDDASSIDMSPDILKSIEERKMMLEAQEREEMRKAYEFSKRREEEIRKGNRRMLLDMKIKGINEKPEKCQVVGFKNGFFSVNGLWVPGSVLVFPNRVFMWGVTDAHDIREHTLDILKVIKPRPNYLIIGTGKYNVDFDPTFYEYFRNSKILVETMPTFEAISHFNNCNDDDMEVCAALIPSNL